MSVPKGFYSDRFESKLQMMLLARLHARGYKEVHVRFDSATDLYDVTADGRSWSLFPEEIPNFAKNILLKNNPFARFHWVDCEDDEKFFKERRVYY